VRAGPRVSVGVRGDRHSVSHSAADSLTALRLGVGSAAPAEIIEQRGRAPTVGHLPDGRAWPEDLPESERPAVLTANAALRFTSPSHQFLLVLLADAAFDGWPGLVLLSQVLGKCVQESSPSRLQFLQHRSH
jgi:hypothetical protein